MGHVLKQNHIITSDWLTSWLIYAWRIILEGLHFFTRSTPSPVRSGCVSLNQRAVPGLLLGQVLRWWPTSKQNEHLFSDMHACGMGYFTKNMTYGWDQEGKCGLSGATCTLVQSSTLSSMQSTRSDAPVSLKAMCVGAVAIWVFVVWALEMHAAAFTAVFSTIVSAWLTAAVAT